MKLDTNTVKQNIQNRNSEDWTKHATHSSHELVRDVVVSRQSIKR